jgi:hypothetical protein
MTAGGGFHHQRRQKRSSCQPLLFSFFWHGRFDLESRYDHVIKAILHVCPDWRGREVALMLRDRT